MDTRLPLRILDRSTLEAAANILGDAPFDHQDVRYAPSSLTFVMILHRQGDPPSVRSLSFLRQVLEHLKVKPVRCRLTFRHVQHADIDIEEPGGSLLIDLQYNLDLRTIEFSIGGPAKITLHVSELDGELADVMGVNSMT